MFGKNLFFVPLTLMLVGTGRAPAAVDAKAPSQIYDETLPSTVTLHVRGEDGGEWVASGFVVSESGLIATAWHVVAGATKILADFSDGTVSAVSPVAAAGDPPHDLALLQSARPHGRPLILGTKPARVASRVYVIGSPRGYSFSIVEGLVSQVREVDGYAQYQISCPISPGNSGAPVINESGEVVGLVSWSKRGAQNLNFAIPAEHLAALVDSVNVPSAVAGHEQRPQRSDVGQTKVRDMVPKASDDLDRLRLFLADHAGQTARLRLSSGEDTESFDLMISSDGLAANATTPPANEKQKEAGP